MCCGLLRFILDLFFATLSGYSHYSQDLGFHLREL